LIRVAEELENLLPPLSCSTQTQIHEQEQGQEQSTTTTQTPSIFSSSTSSTSDWVTDYYLHVPEQQMPPVSNSVVYVVIKRKRRYEKSESE
jgi:hypothetical protein